MVFHLDLHVEHAKNIVSMDYLSESDTSISLYLATAKWDLYRTKVIDNNNNPVWRNEHFHLFFHEYTSLVLVAQDADYTCWEEIGRATYDFNETTELDKEQQVTLDLMNEGKKNVGSLTFSFTLRQVWQPFPPPANPKPFSYDFKNLVLEGGGVRGIAYGGALEILDKKGILNQIENIAGTSAGALTALGLSFGLSSGEVTEVLKNTNFKSFMDGNITQFFKNYSIYKGDALGEFIKSKMNEILEAKKLPDAFLATKEKREGLSFRQLGELCANYPTTFKSLSVVGTNLTSQRPQVFNKEFAPDFPIWKAVRISMGIPLVFSPILVDGEYYVDGGVAYNYPIDLFDIDGIPNKQTIGIKLDSPIEIASHMGHKVNTNTDQMQDSNQKPAETDPLSLTAYIGNLINFLTTSASESRITIGDNVRTVYIGTGTVGTAEFDLSEERKMGLIQMGRDWTTSFFNWLDSYKQQKDAIVSSVKQMTGKNLLIDSGDS